MLWSDRVRAGGKEKRREERRAKGERGRNTIDEENGKEPNKQGRKGSSREETDNGRSKR